MDFLFQINPLYAASGFAVGLLVGMTGVGGGSLMTPLLILLFGIQPGTAVGTDLLFAAATKSAGTVVHGVGRTIDWRIVGRLAIGSIPATALAIGLLAMLGIEGGGAQRLITSVLSWALLITAAALIFRKSLLRHAARVGTLSDAATRRWTIAMGALLGIMVSISSVGAGAIGVTILLLLYPQLPTARIVGSDIAHAVPLTLLAGSGHWLLGTIDWGLLGSLLVGSIPGIVIASLFAPRLPDAALRYILAATLVIVALRLLL